MTLYTAKGDDGTTTTFGCDQRMSKSSAIAEALGTLDEANSYLGMCKVQSVADNFTLGDKKIANIVHELQDDLFIVQAEVAGADPIKLRNGAGNTNNVMKKKVKWLEGIIAEIEKELPPITTFFISGGTELASRFDFARTLIRRAERRVVGVHDSYCAKATKDKEGVQKVGKHTLAYLNRLSSILYALARFANHQHEVIEDAPDYE